MDVKQNPFSLYDFLGYFTPGAMLIYGAILVAGHAGTSTTAASILSERLSFSHPEIYVPLVITAYTAGHLQSFMSSVTVERYSIWAVGYPSKYLLGLPHDGYFTVSELRRLRIPIRVAIACLLLPISLLDYFLGYHGRVRDLYAKSLDPLLAELLKQKVFMLVTDMGGVPTPSDHEKAKNHDYFRLAYHYAVEHAPHHLPKMQNYVALFGFLRTVTLLSVIFYWTAVWHVLNYPMPCWQTAILLFVSAATSYLFYLAFEKFYRRFSLEALMAVAVSFRRTERSPVDRS